MTLLTSILAKSTSGAVIEMIILLLVAGLIAYLTAYFYYRAVYTKQINALNEEKQALERRISVMETELKELKEKLAALEKKPEK